MQRQLAAREVVKSILERADEHRNEPHHSAIFSSVIMFIGVPLGLLFAGSAAQAMTFSLQQEGGFFVIIYAEGEITADTPMRLAIPGFALTCGAN